MLSQSINKELTLNIKTRENPLWLIQNQMKLVENKLRQPPSNQQEWLVDESDRIFNAGGKRLRPAISLLVSEIFGNDLDKSINLSAGVEILHTATLVHDDLIDQAQTRRGVTTTASLWSSDAAVLMGDYLFARAAELVARTDSVRVTQLFSHTLMVILNGEISQRATRWNIDREDYYQRIYSKTAAVFVLAAQAAAVLGQATSYQEQALIEFGRLGGMAFQIMDDILDIIGAEETIGKPTGNDLRQGLFTLPVIYFFESHPDDPDIHWLLHNKEPQPEIIARLIDKIHTSFAISEALTEAKEFSSFASQELTKLPDSCYTQSLGLIIDAVVERKF